MHLLALWRLWFAAPRDMFCFIMKIFAYITQEMGLLFGDRPSDSETIMITILSSGE